MGKRLLTLLVAIISALAVQADDTGGMSIVRAEYFYDTDPGYGQATIINNVTEGDNQLSLSVSGLTSGAHTVFLRSQASNGVWSATQSHSFYLASYRSGQASRIEYFFDTDPGYGNGFSVDATNDSVYSLPLNDLAYGAHTLYLRVQDNHGRWSAVQPHPIFVTSNVPDVVAIEYFFDDNDPGEGLATAVALPADKTAQFAFEANTEGLAAGEHRLNVRLQNSWGTWTLFTAAATFTVNDNIEIVGNTDLSSEIGSDFSSNYEIPADYTLKMQFTNHSSKQYNWNNWILTCSADSLRSQQYFQLRADAYGTGDYYNAEGLTNDWTDWDAFREAMDGALVDLTVRRLGSEVKVTTVAHSTNGTESVDLTQVFTTNIADAATLPINVALTIDNSYLEIYKNTISLTPTETDVVLETVATPAFRMEDTKLYLTTETEGADIYYSMTEFTSESRGTGTKTDPYNVAAAIAYINTLGEAQSEDSICVRGIVASINEISTQYGNATFYLSDNGLTDNAFTAYRVLGRGNQKFTEDDVIKVGDEVTLYGKVVNYKGNTPETVANSAYIYNLVRPEVNTLYEGPLVPAPGTIVRAKAVKLGMNDSEVAIYATEANQSEPEAYAVLTDNTDVISSDESGTVYGKTLTFYYDNQKAARGGMNINTSWLNDNDNSPYGAATTAVFDASFGNYRPTTTEYWFQKCTNLTRISGIENLKTDSVINMGYMFRGCSSLTSLDLSSFNTANVINMWGMFEYCSSLQTLDLRSFDTRNVEEMAYMFNGCNSLRALDVTGFNTDNVREMGAMFQYCSALSDIDVTGFNTTKNRSTWGMFRGLSVSTLDLSSFNTAAVDDMGYMFADCPNLTTIYVGDGWSTQNVAASEATGSVGGYDMFAGCTSLVGGAGTTYNPDYVTETYARIDGGAAAPGYLTDGNAGTTIYVQASVAPYLYAFDADGKELNGSFPGELMTDTINVNGTVFLAKKIRQTAPFNINIIDTEQYRTREIYVISDRYFVYEGKDVYTDVTRQYFDAPDIEISSIALPGGHNTWNKTALMTEVEQGKKYTMEVDLTDVTIENDLLQFKLFANACAWLGFTSVTLDAPSYVYNIGDPAMYTDSRNFVMDISQTTARKFNFEATWNGGYQMEEGWTLKITPIVPEPYAVLADNTLTFYYDDQKTARGGIDINNSYINIGSNSPYYTITTAVIDDSFADYRPTSTAYWFMDCSLLTSIIGMENIRTDNVIDMSGMFAYCSSLTSLDVSHFNTENVWGGSMIFHNCSSLTSLDVSNFNTSKFTGTYCMFSGCSSLTSLDVSHFDMSNVTLTNFMFNNCSSLTSLDVSNFDMSNVEQARGMFQQCSSLTNLDVSHFNTEKMKDTYAMFMQCSSLTTLDLTSFKTDSVTNMNSMFYRCSNLNTVYVGSGWSTEAVTNSEGMFTGCMNLVGGRGTTYDAEHIDQAYAHIDEGITNPGYFTPKYGYDFDVAFDGLVLKVDGNITMSGAMDYLGGRDKVVPTLAAVIWNNDEAISNSDMQDIENPNLLLYVSNKALAPGNVKNIVVGDSVNGYKAQQIVLTETESGNGNFYCPIAFTANRITYEREFRQQTETGKCRGWETIVLPFTVQSIMHERNGQLRPFAAEGSGRPFWLRELGSNGFVDAKQIEANKAYVISMPNEPGRFDAEYQLGGRVTFSGYGCQVPVTSRETSGSQAIRFIPALSTVAQSDSVYTMNVSEEYAVGATIYEEGSIFVAGWSDVRPFHCYTQHTASSPAPRYMPLNGWLDESTTSINEKLEMNNEKWEMTNEKWYMLDGRKLQSEPRQRGVYIMNGKKVKR